MNKRILKFLALITLVFLVKGNLLIRTVRAEDNLALGIIGNQEYNVQSGDSYVVSLKLTNNTEKILDGKIFLHINYQGVCSNNKLINFDGEGIKAIFSINNHNLSFSDWKNGTSTVSDFKIAKNKTYPKLRIDTNPALCPGQYFITFTIQGTAESETYTATAFITGNAISSTTTVPSITTTVPGRVAGAETRRERSILGAASPITTTTNIRATTTATTATTTITHPMPVDIPISQMNPFLASILGVTSHINPWLMLVIALLSFGGAFYLFKKEKKTNIY